MKTPWGQSDYQVSIIRGGVTDVGTPSHGGLMVRKEWADQCLSAPARDLGTPFTNREGEWIAYEEDCAYAIVLWEMSISQREYYCRRILVPNPQRTPESYQESLRDSLSRNYPAYLIERGDALNQAAYQQRLDCIAKYGA